MDPIKESFEKICQQAKQDAAKVELLLSKSENLSLKFSQKKLEKFESTDSQTAGLRVILGASQGYASTENLSTDGLLRTYREALSNAKMLQSNQGHEIPLAKPAATSAMKELDQAEEVSIEEKMDAARLLEAACFDFDPRIQSVPYPNFNETRSMTRVLNSNGLDQEFKRSYYSGYCYPLAKEGNSTKMDGETFFVRRFQDVDAKAIAKEGVRKATSLLGAQKVPTGHYAVVIDREQMETVLSMLIGYFSAKALLEGKSLLEGKLGKTIASPLFQLTDDPQDLRGASARPFDSEGAPSQTTVLVQDGVLKSYLTNLEYAQKMNLPHTANAARSPATLLDIAPSNLVVKTGSSVLPQMLSSHDKVVHLTKFTGGLHAGFKNATGDFSMPAEGFLYENGKCVGPIDQFVLSGNVLELLRDIEMVGNKHGKIGHSFLAPDVLVKSLSIAGA